MGGGGVAESPGMPIPRVLAVRTMRPGRLSAVRLRARHVIEAEAGAMERWGLRTGGQVQVVADGG